MKKIFISAITCLLAVVTYAQSTCETRVDAHQKATTKQRVAYCLTPDTVETNESYPGLVFSGVSSHQPKTVQSTSERPTTKPGRFVPEKVTVSRNYVATAQFPEVAKDNGEQAVEVVPVTTSVETQEAQPVLIEVKTTNTADEVLVPEEKFVYVPSPTVPPANGETTTQVNELKPVEHFMTDEANFHSRWEQAVVETKAGVKARQTKPGRQMKQPVFVEEQTEQQPEQEAQTEAVSYTDNIYLYNEPTDEAAQTDAPDTLKSYNPYEEVPAVDAVSSN